jgi:hypothetical protein
MMQKPVAAIAGCHLRALRPLGLELMKLCRAAAGARRMTSARSTESSLFVLGSPQFWSPAKTRQEEPRVTL